MVPFFALLLFFFCFVLPTNANSRRFRSINGPVVNPATGMFGPEQLSKWNAWCRLNGATEFEDSLDDVKIKGGGGGGGGGGGEINMAVFLNASRCVEVTLSNNKSQPIPIELNGTHTWNGSAYVKNLQQSDGVDTDELGEKMRWVLNYTMLSVPPPAPAPALPRPASALYGCAPF